MKKLLLFSFVLVTLPSLAQQSPCVPQDTLASNKLVVYHSKLSSYPKSILVSGEIIEMTGGVCGYFCSGGIIKVKLATPIEGYQQTHAFLVTACLNIQVRCGDWVQVEASQLTGQEVGCCYTSVLGGINSNGIPFYKLSEEETKKIIPKSTK